MLVYAAPEDQKQQVWSAERQRFIGTGLVSPNEIPEMYPGEQALQAGSLRRNLRKSGWG